MKKHKYCNAAAIILIIILLPVSVFADIEIHYLDVGQGDCAIVLCGNEAMVIDGDPHDSSSFVYSYIKNTLKLRHIDYMICTYPHLDHVYGLSSVLNAAVVDLAMSPVLEWDSKSFSYMKKICRKTKHSYRGPARGRYIHVRKCPCHCFALLA